jgi:dTDP-4-dehydrorhamnose 3,5-epimerase
MICHPARLPGAAVIDPEPVEDERGLFARGWRRREFASRGLGATWVPSAVSDDARAGTWREVHDQAAPHAAAKLVRCARGAIVDVIVDIRPTSDRRFLDIEPRDLA